MKITKVEYSASINLGDYNNEKVGFVAEVGENELPEEVVEKLRSKVKEVGGTNASALYDQIYKGKQELASLERKIKQANLTWNQTAEFLKAQGLKSDPPSMPQFTNLLSEVKEEKVFQVEGELF